MKLESPPSYTFLYHVTSPSIHSFSSPLHGSLPFHKTRSPHKNVYPSVPHPFSLYVSSSFAYDPTSTTPPMSALRVVSKTPSSHSHITTLTAATHPTSQEASTSPSFVRIQHLMLTHSKRGIFKPIKNLYLHVDSYSSIPRTYSQVVKDPNSLNVMTNEFTILISNQTLVLVP